MNIAGLLLAILIVLLSSIFAVLSHADGVCGDGAIDAPEQCDDGNLSNGDGCSLSCTRERCGNGTVDSGEQCDDGAVLSGDGCSKACFIEFCGDTLVATGMGEQCDDGNGLSGDGCSSVCKDETKAQASSASSVESSEAKEDQGTPPVEDSQKTSPDPSADSETDKAPDATAKAKAPLSPQVIAAVKFILSPKSAEYREYLSDAEEGQLLQVLQKLANGEPLFDQEKIWAQELVNLLTAARSEERARYTDLLKEFISTPISSDVLAEKGLARDSLVNVAVPIAIDELNQAIAIIQRGELKQSVMQSLEKLKRQGIDLSKILPKDFLASLEKGARPIDVFAMLKAIKEAAEVHATTDLPLSLQVIRVQIGLLREALPMLQQEFGVDAVAIEALLAAIEEKLQNATAQNVYSVVAAINQLIDFLMEKNILSLQDLQDDASLHPAARALQMLEATGESVDTAGDIRSLLRGLGDKAPAKYKEAFEHGSLEDQQAALLLFLDDDEQLQTVLKMLRDDGDTGFDDRLYVLRQHISNVGITKDTETECDNSMSDALHCVTGFLSDVQDAARSRNFFTDVIGRLQDYFGIGQ